MRTAAHQPVSAGFRARERFHLSVKSRPTPLTSGGHSARSSDDYGDSEPLTSDAGLQSTEDGDFPLSALIQFVQQMRN